MREHQDQLIFSRTLAQPVTTREQMRQVLSLYAQKGGARLTGKGMRAGHVSMFCSSGHYAAAPAASPHIEVALGSPTDDPTRLSKAAMGLLEAADFDSGVRYAGAGFGSD